MWCSDGGARWRHFLIEFYSRFVVRLWVCPNVVVSRFIPETRLESDFFGPPDETSWTRTPEVSNRLLRNQTEEQLIKIVLSVFFAESVQRSFFEDAAMIHYGNPIAEFFDFPHNVR